MVSKVSREQIKGSPEDHDKEIGFAFGEFKGHDLT